MCRASGRCRFPARVQPLWHQLSLSRRLLNGSVAPRAAPRLPPHFGSVRHPRMRRLDSECVISAAYAAAYDHVCLPHLGIVRLWGAVSDKLNPLRNTARGGGPKNKRVMHALLWTRPLKLKASHNARLRHRRGFAPDVSNVTPTLQPADEAARTALFCWGKTHST